jgi:hypothetical protein
MEPEELLMMECCTQYGRQKAKFISTNGAHMLRIIHILHK